MVHADRYSEDDLIVAIDSGAEDVTQDGDSLKVTSAAEDLAVGPRDYTANIAVAAFATALQIVADLPLRPAVAPLGAVVSQPIGVGVAPAYAKSSG